MQIPAETVDAIKAIGGFLFAIGAPLWAVGKVIARRKATAYAREWLKSQGEPVDDDDPKTPLLEEGDLVRSLRRQLDEIERLHAAEARGLRNRVRELQGELDAVKGDLVVASQERLKAERHATQIIREWRASQGLRSDAPPANPLSSSAVTVPPKGR